MAARSKARKRALDLVFEADVRQADLGGTLHAWRDRADPPVQDHAARLVDLVVAHAAAVDAAVADRLVGWTLDRVAPVDRAILRIATVELLWVDDVPDAVVIDEAVELAKSLSTDESPAFVNGVLARVAADKQSLVEQSSVERSSAEAGAAGSAQVERPGGLGLEDAPVDQPLGELAGTLVVDHGE